jgi:L-threonylcarbamoyladenylate synthase
MHTVKLQDNLDEIKIAAEIIKGGGIVAFPTETVYGLGANALNEEAVKAVYLAKGRPSDNPMIVHIGNMGMLDQLVQYVNEDSAKLMKACWPGPITFILPKSDLVPSVTCGGLDTVAIRMPANKIALALINASGVPIAAPSANISGRPSPTNYQDVVEDMDGRIDAIIQSEDCKVGIESTVVNLCSGTPVILRPGFYTKEKLTELLGKPVEYDRTLYENGIGALDPAKGASDIDGFKPMSPGMKYKHYAPKAQVRLIRGNDESARQRIMTLGLEAKRNGEKVAVLDYDGDAEKAAKKFFADLRELDRQNYDLILVRTLDEEGFGFSIMNRMLKSAGYDIVED